MSFKLNLFYFTLCKWLQAFCSGRSKLFAYPHLLLNLTDIFIDFFFFPKYSCLREKYPSLQEDQASSYKYSKYIAKWQYIK